jgi:hypothetical protein
MRTLCLAIAFGVALATPEARPATLVETSIGGQSVWVIDDPLTRRVLIASHAGNRLVDLATETVYLIAPDGASQKVAVGALPPVAAVASFEIEKIGPGPRVADYPTTRFRLSAGGETCSVIDANLGLSKRLDQAMRAFDLMARLNAALGGADRGPCERIPLGEYARIGWGLRVADAGAPVVETKAVVPDYEPLAEELALPAEAVDITKAVIGAPAR